MHFNPRSVRTSVLLIIVIAAGFLNFVMSAIGLTTAITDTITGLGWSPMWMLLAVVVTMAAESA